MENIVLECILSECIFIEPYFVGNVLAPKNICLEIKSSKNISLESILWETYNVCLMIKNIFYRKHSNEKLSSMSF